MKNEFALAVEQMRESERQGRGTLSVESCSGDNCGDALANFLNSGPLKDTGLALPRGGVGPGDLAEVGKARGASVLGRGDLSLDNLTPGTVIHMTRQPGDKNYEYGSTHIGIVDEDEQGNKMFKSFTAGRGWRNEVIDQRFIDRLPAQITATNPVNPSGGWLTKVSNALGPSAVQAGGLPTVNNLHAGEPQDEISRAVAESNGVQVEEDEITKAVRESSGIEEVTSLPAPVVPVKPSKPDSDYNNILYGQDPALQPIEMQSKVSIPIDPEGGDKAYKKFLRSPKKELKPKDLATYYHESMLGLMSSIPGVPSLGPPPPGGYDEMGNRLDAEGRLFTPGRPDTTWTQTVDGLEDLNKKLIRIGKDPHSAIVGAAELGWDIGTFGLGLINATAAAIEYLPAGIMKMANGEGSVLDAYNVMKDRFQDMAEFTDPGKQWMKKALGLPADAADKLVIALGGTPLPKGPSEAVGEAIMLPLTMTNSWFQGIADEIHNSEYPMPNTEGLLRFMGEGTGFFVMAKFHKGGIRGLKKGMDVLGKEINEFRGLTNKGFARGPDMDEAWRKLAEVKAGEVEGVATEIAKEFDPNRPIIDEVQVAGEEAVKKAEVVEEVPVIEEPKPKPLTAVERAMTKKAKEVKVEDEIVPESEPKPTPKPKVVPTPPERTVVETDPQTSSFRQDPEVTRVRTQAFDERGVQRDLLSIHAKALNDVNRWLDGDAEVSIEPVRRLLSDLAAKVEDPANNRMMLEILGTTPEVELFKEITKASTTWARRAKRETSRSKVTKEAENNVSKLEHESNTLRKQYAKVIRQYGEDSPQAIELKEKVIEAQKAYEIAFDNTKEITPKGKVEEPAPKVNNLPSIEQKLEAPEVAKGKIKELADNEVWKQAEVDAKVAEDTMLTQGAIEKYYGKSLDELSDAEVISYMNKELLGKGGGTELYSGIPVHLAREYAKEFYSRARNFISKKLSVTGSGPDMARTIQAWADKGVMPGKEELRWTGVVPWLQEKKGKVTRQEVVDFLEHYKVDLEVVEKGESSAAEKGNTKFESYVKPPPGSTNYREFYGVWPGFEGTGDLFRPPHVHRTGDAYADINRIFHAFTWDQVINRKKYLVIGELQSDWAGKGRREGYGDETEYYVGESPKYATRAEADAYAKNHDYSLSQVVKYTVKGTPEFPFSKNWMEVAMKKMLRQASEEGYDGLAWVSGDVIKERYDLSKEISRIDYYKSDGGLFAFDYSGNEVIAKYGIKPEQLPNYIGKDVADRLLKQGPEHSKGTTRQKLEGEDLKVGGEWANKQYDSVNPITGEKVFGMPVFMDKYGKQWGARVENKKIEWPKTEHEAKWMPEENQLEPPFEVPDGSENVHTLDITPKMKDSVLYEGQYFYSGIPAHLLGKAIKNIFRKGKEERPGHEDFKVIQGAAHPEGVVKSKMTSGKYQWKVLGLNSKTGKWDELSVFDTKKEARTNSIQRAVDASVEWTKLYREKMNDSLMQPEAAAEHKRAERAKRNQDAMREFKEGNFTKWWDSQKKFLGEMIHDRAGRVRSALLKHFGESGQRLLSYTESVPGGPRYGEEKASQMRREVEAGLDKEMLKSLFDYHMYTRYMDIWKDHPKWKIPIREGEIAPKQEQIVSIMANFKVHYKLSDTEFKLIQERSELMFEHMRNWIDDSLLASGIIGQKEANDLKDHRYTKMKALQTWTDVFDKESIYQVGDQKTINYDSGIQRIAGGGLPIVETDQFLVYTEVARMLFGRAANQRARQAMREFATQFPDNNMIWHKGLGGKKPKGWQKDYVWDFETPVESTETSYPIRQPIWLHPDFAHQVTTVGYEMSARFSSVAGKAFGGDLVRTLAVGISPVWATIVNLPIDILHTFFSPRIFKDGKEVGKSNAEAIFSPFFPKYLAELGSNYVDVASDVWNRGPKYQAYARYGGLLQFLTQRQSHVTGQMKRPGKFAELLDILSAHGRNTELLTRLAIMDRVVGQKADELGMTKEVLWKRENARPESEILRLATHVARENMPYGQTGWMIKALDRFIPFMGANYVGGKTFWRAAIERPADFATRISNIGAAAVGITAMSLLYNPEAWREIPDWDRERNVCIPFLSDYLKFKDSNGEKRTWHIKIPGTGGPMFFYNLFSWLTHKFMYDSGMTKMQPDYSIIPKSVLQNAPAQTMTPPIVSALLSYTKNMSFWQDRNIFTKLGGKVFSWPGSSVEGMNDSDVSQLAKDIGGLTGFSPKRLQGSFSEIVPTGNEFIWAFGKAYEGLFNSMPEKLMERTWQETIIKSPGFKRLFGLSFLGAYRQVGDEARWKQQEAVDKRDYVRRSEFDKIMDEREKGGEVRDKLRTFYREVGREDEDARDRFEDEADQLRMIERLPNKSLWKGMLNKSNELKAMDYYERMKIESSPEEQASLRRELRILEDAGFISDDFHDELRRIRRKNQK